MALSQNVAEVIVLKPIIDVARALVSLDRDVWY